MINLMLYYILSSSVVFFYGVGLNRLLIIKKDSHSFFISILRTFLVTNCVVIVSYAMSKFVLIPLNLSELFTFFVIFIFIGFSILFNLLLKIEPSDLTEDFVVPLLSIFISLNEGLSLFSCILITVSCIISFYTFLIMIFSYQKRFNLYSKSEGLKPFCLLLISFAIVIIALCSWNVSWLTAGLN